MALTRHILRQRSLWILLSVILLSTVAAGCSTPDSQRLSERPWNSPKGWEHGIPQSLLEPR